MTNLEPWVLSYVVNSLWQAPLLFAAGLLAARALRPAGAEAGHRAWVAVLILESVLPACSPVPFSWLRTLLIWNRDAHAAGNAQVTVLIGAGTTTGGFNLPDAAISVIVVAYGAVTAWFAARFLWRWSRLGRMRRRSFTVTLADEPARCWAQCSEHFAVRNALLAASTHVFAPVTMGISRKLLVLPAGITSRISEAEMQSVFAHEFAHMRRNDFLKNCFYELVSLPVSYHPVVWFTRAKLGESREMICDQMAAEIAGRGQYSRSLLRLASLLSESTPSRTAHALGIFDSNTLERRLMKLADHPSEIRGLRRFAAIAACLALGAATSASALALRMQVNSTEETGHHPTAHPTKVNVSPEIMQNQVIHKVVPKYPADAKKARIQGKVVLNAVIGKDGSVTDLKVDSGPKELRQSSLDAVKQWKYKPYLLNGQPVAVATTINVIYSLARPGSRACRGCAVPPPPPPPPPPSKK